MKKIILIIKKIVLGICMIYAFNLIISKSGYIVPINISSITTASFLGIPGIIALLVLKTMIK